MSDAGSRRRFLRTAGAAAVAGLAGCSAERVSETPTASPTESGGATTTGEPTPATADTLVVATYPAFVDAPSSSPGGWLKQEFEAEYDASIVYQTPENEVNYYIERAVQGVDYEADVYVGLDTDTLIRVDRKRGEGEFTRPLFAEASGVEGRESVKPGLEFDPRGRAVPFDTGYISLVWNATKDGGEFVAPETFDGLLESAYEGDLIAQSPVTSATGKAFLLHTIKAKGEDGYLDYWRGLRDNGVRVLGSWSDAYSAYTNGEAPMVVSYSTDQVYANRYDQDMRKHQIRFLNDQGYANPEGMARFRSSNAPELARQFMSFLLRPEIQAGIAKRNVSFPAVPDAPLSEEYSRYAKEPPEPVTFTYDELKGKVGTWTDRWQRVFSS